MAAAIWVFGLPQAHSQGTSTQGLTNIPLLTNTTGPVNPSGPANTSTATNNLAKPDAFATDAVIIPKPVPEKQPVRSEIAVMGMIPDGDYRMFSATVRCNAWTVAVEYDRHSWGHLMGAEWDYVVEVIPVLILSEPAKSDFWGNAMSPNQQLVPGLSISPFGFRWLWRHDRAIKPYIVGKLGAAVFTEKAFSKSASYTNFNVQAAFGLQFKMTERWDLRVEPFQFYHVSNGYLAASNPGMDELATRIGVSYYIGKRPQSVGR